MLSFQRFLYLLTIPSALAVPATFPQNNSLGSPGTIIPPDFITILHAREEGERIGAFPHFSALVTFVTYAKLPYDRPAPGQTINCPPCSIIVEPKEGRAQDFRVKTVLWGLWDCTRHLKELRLDPQGNYKPALCELDRGIETSGTLVYRNTYGSSFTYGDTLNSTTTSSSTDSSDDTDSFSLDPNSDGSTNVTDVFARRALPSNSSTSLSLSSSGPNALCPRSGSSSSLSDSGASNENYKAVVSQEGRNLNAFEVMYTLIECALEIAAQPERTALLPADWSFDYATGKKYRLQMYPYFDPSGAPTRHPTYVDAMEGFLALGYEMSRLFGVNRESVKGEGPWREVDFEIRIDGQAVLTGGLKRDGSPSPPDQAAVAAS